MPLGHGNWKIRKGNVIGAEERFHHLVYNFVPHIVFKCRWRSDRQLPDVGRLNKLLILKDATQQNILNQATSMKIMRGRGFAV